MEQNHTFLLRFAFRGDAYAGWQRQISVLSVQQVMEDALRRILKDPELCLTGCSRTDAGVHALEMCASFSVSHAVDTDVLLNLLRVQLPHDIRILGMEEKPSGFNAHTGVCGRAYVYTVYTGGYSLFLKDRCQSWPDVPEDFDMEPLKQTVSLVRGTHDFRNFTGKHRDAVSTARHVYRAEVIPFGRILCFYISADGFLYQMIRRLAARWHETAAGRCSPGDFALLLDGPEQPVSDSVAPACGLYLKKVFHGAEDWRKDTLESPPFCF